MPRHLTAEQVEDFRRDLCDVAASLFASEGYDAVTMKSIAGELGVSAMGSWGRQEYLVAADGSLWADWPEGKDRCAGVLRFDGLSTRRFSMPGMADDYSCLDGMDITPDGSVWVAAGHDLYVITPEAVAGTE